ncbi:hypothetical protein BDQ17DRAFT_1439355 [Cyathus striatus]|nr:hypothetical protein BDQ17DRAFT_1439355 [Cyathus striatus]
MANSSTLYTAEDMVAEVVNPPLLLLMSTFKTPTAFFNASTKLRLLANDAHLTLQDKNGNAQDAYGDLLDSIPRVVWNSLL